MISFSYPLEPDGVVIELRHQGIGVWTEIVGNGEERIFADCSPTILRKVLRNMHWIVPVIRVEK